MKPDNPPATLQEGCQFRRNIPRDEGKSNAAKPREMQGFFVTCVLEQLWWGRV